MLFALMLFACCVMGEDLAVTGEFVAPIYKIEEKASILESRLQETEDIERHVLNKLDQAAADMKKTLLAADKEKIAEVQKWLKNKAALLVANKKEILDNMKKILGLLPAEERMGIIRRLKIEHRFNSVKEMIQDATRATGFTEKQINEFHDQQIKRAKFEKKQAEAREKLAKAEAKKAEAQKKAAEAERVAKEKEKQAKAAEAKKAEAQKKAAEAKKAETQKKAAEAKKAEAKKKATEAKKVETKKKAAEAKKIAKEKQKQAKAAADVKKELKKVEIQDKKIVAAAAKATKATKKVPTTTKK